LADPLSHVRDATDPGDEHAGAGFPELVTGRGRLRDYALKRIKASRLLQVSMVLAVLSYGAIPFLVIYPTPEAPRLQVEHAALMMLMSLASWSLLFWWYPVFKRTQKVLGDDSRGRRIARGLESFAIGCVVAVHALMALIVLLAAALLKGGSPA
jgi:hypothetical protein